MDEFEFINSIKPSSYTQSSLIKGIGDDAAVFRTTEDIVTAVDTFVEGIHFMEETMTPFHIGYKTLAANISDIAAMGAEPKFYLVSIVIPKNKPDSVMNEIFLGMKHIASKYSMDLIGGDTVSGKELTISITVIGYVEKEKACYRSNAHAGDVVFTTGMLGGSRAGLEILTNNLQTKDNTYFIKRHQMPEPRVEFGRGLSQLDRIALNDVSDGIASELHEIAVASKVDIIINDQKVPIHPYLKQFSQEEQNNWKYFGGEDFELVGTARQKDWPQIKGISQQLNVEVTKIGTVEVMKRENSQVLLKKASGVIPLLKKGYTHLK